MVVCSRNRAPMLANALVAIRAVMRPQDELIVVDSASTDVDVMTVATQHATEVVRTDAPGLGRARNAGWPCAQRPVVAFTDDDCAPDPGWLDALESAFTAATTGFVFGRVRAGAGAGEPLSLVDDALPRTFDRTSLDDPDGFGHGANFACRLEALRDVGGFDDELGAGGRFPAGEDIDVVGRMLRAGWLGCYEPAATVRHDLWRERSAALRVMFNYGVGAGALADKARRLDGHRGGLKQELLDRGLRQVWRDLRAGYEFGAAASLARTFGVLQGARRARRLPTVDGRFRA